MKTLYVGALTGYAGATVPLAACRIEAGKTYFGIGVKNHLEGRTGCDLDEFATIKNVKITKRMPEVASARYPNSGDRHILQPFFCTFTE